MPAADKKKNTSFFAYKAIKEMLSQYQLIPGQKITYAYLSKKLNISNTPIINALHRLEQEEFVVSSPNRGFSIKEVTIEEVKEAFRVREVLELLAIEEAMNNLTSKKLLELEAAMIAHKEIEQFTRNRLAKDAAFHLKIAEIGNNKILSRLLRHLFEQIYLRHRTEGLPHHRISESVSEHQKIFMAIKQKDIRKAKDYLKQHIRESGKATVKGVQETATRYVFLLSEK